MNSAAALVAAARADHVAGAVPMAVQSIDSGAANEKLEAMVRFTAQSG
jgi:anthranilate phosphoribosyltransferase